MFSAWWCVRLIPNHSRAGCATDFGLAAREPGGFAGPAECLENEN